MAKMTVADFILARLAQWGIDRVFGYPGDGINGLIGAFGRQDEGLRFIQARHEEEAAFMACAHAKFTGQAGICLATSGPGAIHLLNGLYDAKLDHQPVVAIVGQQARSSLGGDFQQEVDLAALFKDVAHDFVQLMSTAEQARHLVDRALRIALERRAVTCIIVPNDVQDLPAVPTPPRAHGMMHTGIGAVSHAHVPGEDALHNAAAVLNRGRKVAILAGAGALGASEALAAVADRLGAGVAKALLGKAALSDSLPYVTGSIGLLGTVPSWRLMQDCDTLLMVGTTFPYSEFLPPEGQAACVQIDRDGRALGLRYPIEVGLVGDAGQTLSALLPLLEQKSDLGWRHGIEKQVARWREAVAARAATEGRGVNPQRPFLELSRRLPPDSIITCDSGSAANWYARDVDVRPGMLASLSGGLATMGCAMPYALAGKLAWPDRPVFALVGDGAMQMNGINVLISVADRWRDWKDPRLVVLVLNNGDLNLVTWEQRVMGGDPRFEDSQRLPGFAYAEYARLLGLEGARIEDAAQVGPALDRALAADRPMVLEVMADPEIPPMPPHITLKQFGAYMQALRKDPAGGEALRATLKQWWAS
ncbi:thiamine pyrophosphate-requiring protein [Bordetella hinzii]|uniref:thiamine pyrophosphate-requiring protein n=1 Tax=Bordetella hinzii TaxID=103855 RepID=UPI00045B0134|nr:thiamine pyrophosphate-requiring protein [Bordetella hinzii]KCB34281.1 thiamine pyrophosphate enzyme, N-terminal TPP binding domain protein [Bordetella hinzii CA90 BAL1384]KCB45027.1 thiamine pyrophosphate enzyme, N-terminal TPP binding domain protein [Bordetella hinzii 4161]KCB50995.1 thiamine pyrophosphate enzyme, N-terminal TPP binding domain protein [Bordetella hinzii 1277]KXA71096.1 thiamine pyrophosphate-binding protein [Bordetella hinzii LMG 13501]QDJ38815.1 thiamine pyrophosphate-re